MVQIANNPLASSAATDVSRRPGDNQALRADRSAASPDAASTVQAGAVGVAQAQGESTVTADPTQRVSQVSVSAEARQRLAAENTAQAGASPQAARGAVVAGSGATATETTGPAANLASVNGQGAQASQSAASSQADASENNSTSGLLRQRINELLGSDGSASPRQSADAVADVSGGRGVSGSAEAGQQPTTAASNRENVSPTLAEASASRAEQRSADSRQPSADTNNDLTGNPQRIQRA